MASPQSIPPLLALMVPRTCRVCHETKPLAEFNRATGYRTYGRSYECLACASERQRRYRERNLDRSLARERAKGRGNQIPYSEKLQRYPQKVRARILAASAIQCGRLVRPSVCDDCGNEAKIQAHHEDYSKPLDVAWLCVKCHSKRHRKHAEAK